MSEKKRFSEIAYQWWYDMQPDPSKNKRGDRAALASLRRCDTVLKAMMEPATQKLAQDFGVKDQADLARIALVAAVLAHVREDNRKERFVARQVGTQGVEDISKLIYKPLRFRRLLESEGFDDSLRAFRRLIAIAGKAVNIENLAKSVYEWVKEDALPWQIERADKRRVEWAYYYWGAGAPPIKE